MLSVVQRPFTGDQKIQFAVGETIDSSGFRLERQLISQRYLRPATESEVAEFQQQQKAKKPAASAETRQPKPAALRTAKAASKSGRSAAAPKRGRQRATASV